MSLRQSTNELLLNNNNIFPNNNNDNNNINKRYKFKKFFGDKTKIINMIFLSFILLYNFYIL